MKLLVQRVKEASVSVEGKIVGKISRGLLVFLGFGKGDKLESIPVAVRKLISLRVFPDEQGHMNRSIQDILGKILVISQFTLYADCRKGNRPSFVEAMEFEEAKHFYEHFCQEVLNKAGSVQQGIFGAKMDVSLINEGPVTLILDQEVFS